MTDPNTNRVIRKSGYSLDRNLNVKYKSWNTDRFFKFSSVKSKLPSLKEFVYFASVAYCDHKSNGNYFRSGSDIPSDFVLLATAINRDVLNGYYGVAYINTGKRQIIVSHRGTKLTNVGALYADVKGILLCKLVPQVSSALTFASQMARLAMDNNYDIFFTGHSLGAWLAQLTCFSTIYLEVNDEGNFIRKKPPYTSLYLPYTVVFDSPGTLDFLRKMKDDLFPRNELESQEVNIDLLPVEIFQFHPNAVNACNKAIGTVYLLDLKRTKLKRHQFFKPLGITTHSIHPVQELIAHKGDTAVGFHVSDWRVSNWEVFWGNWDKDEKSTPAEMKKFSIFFFNADEREFLKNIERYSSWGKFEAVFFELEKAGNSLVQSGAPLPWSLLKEHGECVVESTWDRLKFIPMIKHLTKFEKAGLLWWNSEVTRLPEHYVERKLQKLPDDRLFDPKELVRNHDLLLFLVGPPGIGKSSFMTSMESTLREMKCGSIPRIVLRINLNQFQTTLSQMVTKTFSVTELLRTFPGLLPSQLFHSQRDIKYYIYILLDGLDEVCPLYEEVMNSLLEILLQKNNPSQINQELFEVKKVILSSRPHLTSTIQSKFKVNGYSLAPLSELEQIGYLQSFIGTKESESLLRSLTGDLKEMMSNPLMLVMYAEYLMSLGSDLQHATNDLNKKSLYTNFVVAKHKLFVLEKEKAESAMQSTQRRLQHLLRQNTGSYYFYAFNELLGPTCVSSVFGHDKKMSMFKRPEESDASELLSYGILVTSNNSNKSDDLNLRFQHRSFAEYFVADLLLNPNIAQTDKDNVFSLIFRNNVQDNVLSFLVIDYSDSCAVGNLCKNLLSHVEDDGAVVKTFLNSELFSISALKLIDFEHEEILDIFVQPTLVRQNLLTTNQEFVIKDIWDTKGSMDMQGSQFIPLGIPKYPHLASIILSQDQVSSALISNGPSLLLILEPNLPVEKMLVYKPFPIAPERMKNCLRQMNDKDFDKVLRNVHFSKWIAEMLTPAELYALIRDDEFRVSDVVGRVPWEVERVWGLQFLGDISSFRFKFGSVAGKSYFHVGGVERLRFALHKLQKYLLNMMTLSNLDQDPLFQVFCNVVYDYPYETNCRMDFPALELLDCLDEIRNSSGCENVDIVSPVLSAFTRMPCFDPYYVFWNILPWVFQSGSVLSFSTLMETANRKLQWKPLDFVRCLVVLADDNYSQIESHSREIKLNTIFNSASNQYENDSEWEAYKRLLAQADLEKIRSNLKDSSGRHHPSAISGGHVIIIHLQTHKAISDISSLRLEEIIVDIISNTSCCQMMDALRLSKKVLSIEPLQHIRIPFAAVDRYGRLKYCERPSQTNSSSHNERSCWLRSFIQFYFEEVDDFGKSGTVCTRPYLPFRKQCSLESMFPVEVIETLHYFGKLVSSSIIEHVKEHIRLELGCQRWNLRHLLDVFVYETKTDWTRLLELVQLQEMPYSQYDGRDIKASANAIASLLCACRDLYGNERTRIEADILRIWEYCKKTENILTVLLPVLVELGSYAGTVALATPDQMKSTILTTTNVIQIAEKLWGEEHGVTKHLKNIKIQLSISK